MDINELQSYYSNGYSWDEYLLLVNKSANLHKKRYDELKDQDLFERGKTVHLNAMIITEEACGDCAWAIPKLVRVLKYVKNIEIKLFPRREFPELQDNFTTNGKKAVPKLVLLDSKFNVIAEWGPRPAEIQQFVEKSVGVVERTKWYPKVLAYYRGNGQDALVGELRDILKTV